MSGPTCSLVLTAGQADQLLRLVSIGELAIVEHNRSGWLPGGTGGDATLMQRYFQALTGAPSLEDPLRELRGWLTEQERGKQ
jgi:hypothetical protein